MALGYQVRRIANRNRREFTHETKGIDNLAVLRFFPGVAIVLTTHLRPWK
jgi:hypothetical protein